jgi:ABC-2 type transport system ATP-binding protein
MTAALALEGVSKRFGDFQAVQDLGFEAGAGRITGFLGPNGAGKTTTLRMVLGLTDPDAGSIRVLGEGAVRKVRDRIGFLPEERGLYRRMTPLSAIVFLAGLKGMPAGAARRRAQQLLEENGLGEAAHRQIRHLSKGMAQKVQLLAALAHDPDLVLLDEPFSGLDPMNQQALEALVQQLARRGAAVVFSTHVMQHAERLCDQVVLLARGRKVFDGTVAEARSAAPRTLVLEGDIPAAALDGVSGVASVATEALEEAGGVRLTATLEPRAPVQGVLKAAFAKGLELTRFELKEPSLHDAFIVLTGESAS